jgi:hypothetical protein
MVCIAAFIILCLLSVVVGILSIFKRELGKKYWALFKKSWGCVGKKVTLQKCETSFKDDIKNSILKKVIFKKPHLVKPISIGIEILSVLIVIITVWSIVVGVKSGLALYALGSCDVTQPSACALGGSVCSIDKEKPEDFLGQVGLWFTEWGTIFAAIPDKVKHWDTTDAVPTEATAYYNNFDSEKPTALDIFDPGCPTCLQSFRNQLKSGFFDEHNTLLLVYPIQNPDGSFRFQNSNLIARYLVATSLKPLENSEHPAPWLIVSKIFLESNDKHTVYQSVLNEISTEEATTLLDSWLTEFGYTTAQISEIKDSLNSDQISEILHKNRDTVENRFRVNGIPTLIVDGKRHTGLFK